jgi:hypothetical protein
MLVEDIQGITDHEGSATLIEEDGSSLGVFSLRMTLQVSCGRVVNVML